MNELTKGFASADIYEVKLVSSSASVCIIFPKLKFPYPNSFMIVDF